MLRRMSLCRSPLINVVPPLPRYCHSPSHDAPWRLWWATAAAMADDTMGRLIDGQKIVRLSGCWRHEPGKTLSPATPIHVVLKEHVKKSGLSKRIALAEMVPHASRMITLDF
ncbi:uncharacterized protein LOC120705063 isoform X2 [Panicum virgatum]|uniref:uncharacterized protein LOC120705063 isoform X2 n=1 Tax=Panicum virgatum TaxID=38727 RepID=UPI0019D544D1|nr:uncharacterized protein LOC120705063 isoform X2 [Panicum virgatum]